jgi:hypothetical protein
MANAEIRRVEERLLITVILLFVCLLFVFCVMW